MATRVLIADDSMFIQLQLRKFFENEMKFEVVAIAKDGREAVDLYAKHKPDLVTMDITMPNKTGVQAVQEIIAMDPNAKCIMISAIQDADKLTEALKVGAKGYVKKPLELDKRPYVDDLISEIKEALGEK